MNYIKPRNPQWTLIGTKEDKNCQVHQWHFFQIQRRKRRTIIPKYLFDETKLVIIRLPFAPKNEKFSKRFNSKLQAFTNGKFRFHIILNTCKIQSHFNNKDKVQHLSCVIYKDNCSCGADYIG